MKKSAVWFAVLAIVVMAAGASFAYDDNDLKNLKKLNRCVGCDLSGAPLGYANLTNANLDHANLKGANLGGAKLIGAVLTWADLTQAYLGGADISGANLINATWKDGGKCQPGSIGQCLK